MRRKPLTDAPETYNDDDLKSLMRWAQQQRRDAHHNGHALHFRFFNYFITHPLSRRDIAATSLDKAREKGYTKRDWGAYLRNWVRRDLRQFVERHGGIASPDAALNHAVVVKPLDGMEHELPPQLSFIDEMLKVIPEIHKT